MSAARGAAIPFPPPLKPQHITPPPAIPPTIQDVRDGGQSFEVLLEFPHFSPYLSKHIAIETEVST